MIAAALLAGAVGLFGGLCIGLIGGVLLVTGAASLDALEDLQ